VDSGYVPYLFLSTKWAAGRKGQGHSGEKFSGRIYGLTDRAPLFCMNNVGRKSAAHSATRGGHRMAEYASLFRPTGF